MVLRGVPLAAVDSATLGRARQTAAPLAESKELEVQVEPGLREVELGLLHPNVAADATPEKDDEALKARLREIAATAISEGGWGSIPGSESLAALRARGTAASHDPSACLRVAWASVRRVLVRARTGSRSSRSGAASRRREYRGDWGDWGDWGD